MKINQGCWKVDVSEDITYMEKKMVGKRKKVKLNLTRVLVTFGSMPATFSDVM